ncbi:MAG TPA: S1 RNA-binding domain-containing protein [Polyangiaceae bacterium]|jgi:small subunit ribosomal protein S1|nr:S1 RNA-binding domain-containing protein [Polyangiaceae bacterium]
MKNGDDPNSFAALFEASPKKGAPRKWRLGDVLDLEVVRVGKSEVFVALDGKQEGYIEASELADKDGKSKVFEGSRIAARIVQVDRDTGAIRLSPVSTDPILPAVADAATEPGVPVARESAVVPGVKVKGKVVGVERYGVFLEFSVLGTSRPARGLIPVSELGAPRGADLRKLFPLATELSATVLSLDERGRTRLSVTALAAAEERREFESFVAGPEEKKTKGAPPRPTFGTFADLLKKKPS